MDGIRVGGAAQAEGPDLTDFGLTTQGHSRRDGQFDHTVHSRNVDVGRQRTGYPLDDEQFYIDTNR